MEFFIDTAEVNEIKEAYEMGLVDGVTTNPSLIKNLAEIMKKLFVKLHQLFLDQSLLKH